MRGYFGIGVQGLSKSANAGSLFRSAHAFGASFVFTVGATYSAKDGGRVDTSKADGHVPLYAFDDEKRFRLPEGCALVGVELVDDAVDLPSFRHPRQAAYVLGPERGSLSPAMLGLCDHTVKIPTRFCINVGLAGALVMYDRVLTMGRFAPRPEMPGGPGAPLPDPVFGAPLWVRKQRRRQQQADRAGGNGAMDDGTVDREAE